MLNHNRINILLLTLIFLIAGVNVIWYNQGHRPLHWDSSTHLTISLSFHDSVIEKRDDYGFVQTLLRTSWYYPPLVYYLSFPFFLITRNEFAGFLEITFFLLCLIVFVYLTGKKMFNENTGLFAAFCMAMYPIVINFSRDYMLDLPLASITAAGIFVLLKSNNYSNTLFSALAGITIGLGLLTKWTYVLFILMPLIYFLYLGLKGNARKSKVILNFFLCLFLAVIVSLPWYSYNLVPILTSRTGELSRGNLNFVESALYYLKVLPGQVSVLVIIFFIASIFLFRKRQIFSSKFNPYWFVSAYILISLISYKMPRFSIPLLIPFTLIFSDLIINSPNTKKKNIFIIIFGAAALTQYFLISFTNLDNGYRIPITETPLIENLKPNKTDWKNIEVINIINHDRNLNGKERVNVRIIPDEEFFNALTFRYYAMERMLPIEISGLSGYPMFTDYIVIIKPPNEISINEKRINIAQALLSDTSESSKLFEEFRRIKIDDNEIIIFKPRIQKDFYLQTDVVREKIRESSESFLEKYIKPLKNYETDIKFQDSISPLKGKISSMNISVEESLFGDFSFNEPGIKVKNFVLELRNFEISVPGLIQMNKLYIISLDEINVTSFELDRKSLIDYIETSSKGNISVKNSSFGNNKIYLSGYSKDLKTDFEIELSLSQKENSNLYFKIETLKIFGIPFPSFLINYMLSRYNPLVRELSIIKSLRINKMQVINDKIIVGNNY